MNITAYLKAKIYSFLRLPVILSKGFKIVRNNLIVLKKSAIVVPNKCHNSLNRLAQTL